MHMINNDHLEAQAESDGVETHKTQKRGEAKPFQTLYVYRILELLMASLLGAVRKDHSSNSLVDWLTAWRSTLKSFGRFF